MKKCSKCKIEKGASEFYVSGGYCKSCQSNLNKKYHQKVNKLLYDHYGYMCQCCKITYMQEFLQIDHINNDGAKQRREKYNNGSRGGRGVNLIGRANIKKGIFPTDLQTLCSNCNNAKGRYGQCPHQSHPEWFQAPVTTRQAYYEFSTGVSSTA